MNDTENPWVDVKKVLPALRVPVELKVSYNENTNDFLYITGYRRLDDDMNVQRANLLFNPCFNYYVISNKNVRAYSLPKNMRVAYWRPCEVDENGR